MIRKKFYPHTLSDQVGVLQPVVKVHFGPKFLISPEGGQGKPGHVFGPIGSSPGHPLPCTGGEK